MILVTGSSGFIGHALISSFGDNAIGIQRSPSTMPNMYSCDLTSTQHVTRVAEDLKCYSFTHLIHAAAVTPWSKEPDFRLDVAMAQSVIKLCENLKIPNLFFISGWNVYDPTVPAPFSEGAPLNPVGAYGVSKYDVEKLLIDQSTYARVLNLRLASVYGPGQLSSGLIPNLVRSALNDHEISIDANDVKRDYLYINDFVSSVRKLVENNTETDNYLNIGSGDSVSVVEVAEKIQAVCTRLYQMSVRLRKEEGGDSAAPIDNELDISKAKSLGILLNTTSLNSGLSEYVKWRKNENIL